jgi:hypothetical protein
MPARPIRPRMASNPNGCRKASRIGTALPIQEALTVSDHISISMLSASNTCGLLGPFGEKITPTVFEAYLRPRLEELRKYCLIRLIPRVADSDPNYFSKFL